MIASEPLPHFVDDLLGYLHETHPTHATLDGVHTYDDLLEDMSRNAIDDELPRAFADVDDLHLLGDLADAQVEAASAVGSYVEYLETEVAPKARGSFRLGRDKFEQKLRLEEGISMPIERLLAIATREL